MAGNPPPPLPSRRARGNVLTRKLGPAPVYVWVIAAAGLYLGYRYLRGTGTAGGATSSAPSDSSGIPQTVNGTGGTSDSGSAGGGGASAADSLSADLLSTLLGDSAALSGQLADALTGATSTIAGLGSEALTQNGLLEQAIISSYTPAAGGIPSFPSPTSAASPQVVQAASTPTGGQPVVQGTATRTATYTAPPASGTQQKIALATVASDHPTTAAGDITRYYTYKTQVPLRAGQSIHFTKGRGYYAG